MPDEFMRRITNVHNKDLTVYDVLLTFREGSQIKKTPENQISISELVKSKDRDKKMELLFKQLKDVLDPPSELSLPYTTNAKKRGEALYSRIEQSKFYDIDTEKKYSYKLVRGFHSGSTVQYPFAFEILGIPLKDPINDATGYQEKQTKVIGAINYSTSPQDNFFDGDYGGDATWIKDIHGVLREYKFEKNGHNWTKLPCIVIANLVTPRRDPVGYDKSKVDIIPFTGAIVEAVKKMAAGIQTYRSVGIFWSSSANEEGKGKDTGISKISGKELLRQWMIKECGLKDMYPKRKRIEW